MASDSRSTVDQVVQAMNSRLGLVIEGTHVMWYIAPIRSCYTWFLAVTCRMWQREGCIDATSARILHDRILRWISS